MTEQYPRFDFTWLVVIIALFAYVIPHVLNPGVSLSLGAYDFAEFLAKRPFDDRGYYTILALRGQLLLITALLAFSTHRPYFTAHWWARLVVCGILIIAQLPPLTFISNTGDVNQQQQMLLTIGSAILVAIGLSGIFWKNRWLIRVIIGLIGVITMIYSLNNAINIMQDYALPAHIGFGGVALIMIYILIAIGSLLAIGLKQTEPR